MACFSGTATITVVIDVDVTGKNLIEARDTLEQWIKDNRADWFPDADISDIDVSISRDIE